MGVDRRAVVRALAGVGLSLPFVGRQARAQALPEGVPDGSVVATVTGYEDGDKYTVEQNGEDLTVLMISADAPERGKCFYKASADRLEELLPVGTTVYLELDGEEFFDSSARLLAYTWKPREGKTAQFIDERMIADGYSRFKSREGYTKRDARLSKAQETAKEKKRGLWADRACDPTAGRTPTPVPAESAAEAGTPGFSQGIGQARSEFEARFGQPNAQFSQGGMEYYGSDPSNHYTVIYWEGTVWLFTYSVGNVTMGQAQDLALAFIPPDSVLQYDAYPYSYKYSQFYFSESLASRFPPRADAPNADPWAGSAAGVFNVSFNFEEATGLVFEILIGPGERT